MRRNPIRETRFQGPNILTGEDIDDIENSSVNINPVLENVLNRIKKSTCCKVVLKLSFGKNGRIFLKCGDCKKKYLACGWCGVKLSNMSNLKRHTLSQHKDKWIKCRYCNHEEKNLLKMIVHNSIHFRDFGKPVKPKRIMEDEEVEGEDSDVDEEEMFDDLDGGDEIELEIDEIELNVDVNELSEDDSEILDDDDDDIYDLEGSDDELLEDVEQVNFNVALRVGKMVKQIRYLVEEGFSGKIIFPIETVVGTGPFKSYHDLHLAKFSRKANLSESLLSELINDIEKIYKSPLKFQKASTIKKKLSDLSSIGIKAEIMECKNKHKVVTIPIEEMLKYLISKDRFLINMNFGFKNLEEEEGFVHFCEGSQFKKWEDLCDRDGCHCIVIIGNRDDFPGYLFAQLKLKGYYYAIRNLSYPEIIRNVCVYGLGLSCKDCRSKLEQKFVENVNRLFENPFGLYHKLFDCTVKCKLVFGCESDDSPQAADNKMSKKSGAIQGCHECKISHEKYTDWEEIAEKKDLFDSEELYLKCKEMWEKGKKISVVDL